MSPGDCEGMSAAEDLTVGWTTVPTRDEADRLARDLVDSRLAACVQISGPVTSWYRWEGRVESAQEFRLTVKLATSKASAIGAWLEANHPYDTPQWVACRAAEVTEKYLKWALDGST